MEIDEKVSKVEKRISTVEEAVKLLTNLVVNHDERLIHSLKNGEDLNAKMTMLIDAQIRSEDKTQSINQALDKLTDLVKTAHQRIDGLENQSK